MKSSKPASGFAILLLAAAFLPACGLFTPVSATEETEIAAGVSEQVTQLLYQTLGPGKARIFVTIEGEKNTVNTQQEIASPIVSSSSDKTDDSMPGYMTPKY